VYGVALGLEASGVDVENVESLTPNVGNEALGIADLFGVLNADVVNFEERKLGDFEGGKSLSKAAGPCAPEFGLGGGMRARGEAGREDGYIVARVGLVPLGVLTVRGRGTSRSRDALL